jgi:hypothetical protein
MKPQRPLEMRLQAAFIARQKNGIVIMKTRESVAALGNP